MALEIFTIGHSTHSLEDFLALLGGAQIELLADIRRFPGSRKFPHFGQAPLAAALEKAGIGYHWLEGLGGRRNKSKLEVSPNQAWRNTSFRNYADYMLTSEFASAVDELLEHARQRRTALMCSESVFWRCHRRLVSDFLVAHSIGVQHIMPTGKMQPHTLTAGAVVEGTMVTYPLDGEKQAMLFE